MTGLQWFNNNINNKQQSNYNPMAMQYKNQMRTNYGQNGNQSFDMEFMMPPDITSIDSDISKSFFSPHLFRQNRSSDAFPIHRWSDGQLELHKSEPVLPEAVTPAAIQIASGLHPECRIFQPVPI